MKKILPVMIISMLLTACTGTKVVYESADAFQKVSASIETMEVKKNEKTNSTIFHIQTKITNGSDLDLSRVDYQFAGMDCFTWIACDLISPSGEEIPRPGEP